VDKLADTWDHGGEAILRGDGSPLERLERFIEWALADAGGDRGARARVLERSASWDAAAVACVREAVAAGELEGDDPERIGKSLTAMIDGVAIRIGKDLGCLDRETGIRLCLDLLHAHRPEPPRAASRSAEIVQNVVAAWNSHDVERICSFFHEDFENWQSPLPPVRGLASYREHLRTWFRAYPDLRLEIVTLFAEGELVCLETLASGSAAAPFFDVEPRAAAGVNRALDILVLRDGKIWRERGYWDFSLWAGEVSPLARSIGS
jgi:ketosteroid isomerase-like protein